MSFPSIGEYNQTIISKNGHCLNVLNQLEFIPVRLSPIKVYLFGSGANAVVFKAQNNSETLGIRCFLNNDANRIERAKSISRFLENIKAPWKVDYRFIDNEITVKGRAYPIIQMSWSTGKDLNKWVDQNLHDHDKLRQLQKKIFELSKSLEDLQIGHGDIQCGNLLIEEIGSFIHIKLIDYDGMYIPSLSHLQAIENGRAEFQHPSRKLIHYNPNVDRFSFIVILTAIELLIHDKTLWNSPLQNGFNSLDNLLFSARDFQNPITSKLIQRARNLNSISVNFYLQQLIDAINCDFSRIKEPKIFVQNAHETHVSQASTADVEPTELVPPGLIRIHSNVTAVVLNGLSPLGQTPIDLDKSTFVGRELIISNGRGDIKRITIKSTDKLIEILF